MSEPACLRLCRWLIERASLLVPRGEREDWRESWLGEVHYQPPGTTLHSFEVDVDRFLDFFLRRVLAPTGR